jgi:hypothetical protein
MTLGEEASRSLQGAWGLLRRDPAAPTAFNATLDGFWRSFVVAVLLLPLILAYLALTDSAESADQAAPATRWIVSILVYVIEWAAWPLVAFYLARAMNCSDRLLGYLVAYNWSQLLTGPFIIGLAVLARMALSQEDAVIVILIAQGAVLAYEYLIARQMLGVPAGRAIVVVFAAFALSLVLRDTADFALKLAAPGETTTTNVMMPSFEPRLDP